ncbi:MAG: ABC transporter ATP-binding protein, partial [Anaerolineales bacterium]|nr:ABC transporter ATP-binding protein [Anaerolineales bacterium]
MTEDIELIELEEEEHTSQLTAPILRRIATLLKPHWKWVLGFLITIALVSSMDAYFTYLNKQIVDDGINMRDFDRITEIAWLYGSFLLLQAAFIFIFIYLAGVLGE